MDEAPVLPTLAFLRVAVLLLCTAPLFAQLCAWHDNNERGRR
jgi:hypothetical protein